MAELIVFIKYALVGRIWGYDFIKIKLMFKTCFLQVMFNRQLAKDVFKISIQGFLFIKIIFHDFNMTKCIPRCTAIKDFIIDLLGCAIYLINHCS